jgi:hypothetical protein
MENINSPSDPVNSEDAASSGFSPDDPRAEPSDPSCGIAVIRHAKIAIAKRVTFDQIEGKPRFEEYPNVKHLDIHERKAASIHELAAVLEDVSANQHAAVIRGRPLGGLPRKHVRRLLHARTIKSGRIEKIEPATIEEAPRRWVALDFDSIECPPGIDPAVDAEEIVDHLVTLLPPEFHGVTCWWQLTSGAGIKTGIRARLFFWLSRALDAEELKNWLADAPVDPAVFRPVQPIYIARPIFVGMSDPCPRRSGTWRGHGDEVEVPEITKPALANSASGAPAGDFEPGLGYAGHRALIGDHSGGKGFHGPIGGCIGAYFRKNGSAADTAWLRADLEAAIRERQGRRDKAYTAGRVRDLDTWIENIRQRQAADEKAREAEAEKPIDPSWTMPTATAREAAAASDAGIKAFFQDVRAGYPDGSLPPQIGIAGEMASGKTRSTTRHGITEIIAGMPNGRIAIFLPGHIQTSDVARRFEDAADDLADAFDGEAEADAEALAKVINNRYGRKLAHVWRGTKQIDPEKANYDPPRMMCPLAAQADQVDWAGGKIDRMCHIRGVGFCDQHPRVTISPCGRQKQKAAARDPQNRIWIFPHNMVGRAMPAEFSDLPPWSAVVIDEAPWSTLTGGCNSPYGLIVSELNKLGSGDFVVPDRNDEPPGTANDRIRFIRDSLCAAIGDQDSGWLLASTLRAEGLTAAECAEAARLIRRLKWNPNDSVELNWTLERAQKRMEAFQRHNGLVNRFARLFKQLEATLNGAGDKSPYLKFIKETEKKPEGDVDAVSIGMTWKTEIDDSWATAPILYLDGTMQPERARLWLPRLEVTCDVKAAMPAAVYVRQVQDRVVAHGMIKPDPTKSDNTTRQNNAIAAARVLEVKAARFAGHGAYVKSARARIDGLAVMPKKTEEFIRAQAPVPENIHLGHHNNMRGVNLYERVAYTANISRPLPAPAVIERIAWTETGVVGQELDAGTDYPTRTVGRLMRDGSGRAAEAVYHPDPAAERVRWATCEGELLQIIARPRPIWRDEQRPLLIDIITSVPLPIAIDDLITWEAWKAEGNPIELLEARGIILGDGRDMAAFASGLLPEEWETPEHFHDWRRHGGEALIQAKVEMLSRVTRNPDLKPENLYVDSYILRNSGLRSHFIEPTPTYFPPRVYATFAVFVARRQGGRCGQVVAVDLAKHDDPWDAIVKSGRIALDDLQIVYLPLEAALAYIRRTRDFDTRARAALAIYRMADIESTHLTEAPGFMPVATRHFSQFPRPVILPNGWTVGAKLPPGTEAAARRFVDEIALLSSPGTIDAVRRAAESIDPTAKDWLPGLIAAWRRNRTETRIEPTSNGRLEVTVTETPTWIDDAGNTHQGRAPLSPAEVAYMKRRRDPTRPRVIRGIDNGSEEWYVIDPAAHRREIEAMTDAEILAAAGGDHVHGDSAALAKRLREYAARSPAHAREVFLPGRWPKEAA